MNAPVERNAVKTLHTALWVGCLFFLLVTCYLWKEGTVPMGKGLVPYAGGAVLAAILVPVSFIVFRSKLAKASSATSLEDGQQAVRAACITHWAILEGAFFVNDTFFMLEGDVLSLAVAALCIGLLAARAPTAARWERWLAGRP